MSRDGSLGGDVTGTFGVVGSASSAEVVVVVDVGTAGCAVPCVVVVVDVVGTLGELGVMTVELVVEDEPLGDDVVLVVPVVPVVTGGGAADVLSANDRLASVVLASMVALTINNF